MTDLDKIKAKLDIVEVISSYGIEAKRAGSNFKASCPFHQEKTASFMINPQIQIYKCFGCGNGGDAIKFIQEIEKVSFPDAMKIAADKAGIELSNVNYTKDKKADEEKKRIIEANTITAKFYNYVLNKLPQGEAGRAYADKRKIDKKRVEDFLVGYAPKSYSALKNVLLKRGFKETELVAWGLLVDRNGSSIDKFRERLMQPIFDTAGNILGFSGRYIGTNKDTPKYLNSPETPIYKKNELLYGLYQGKDAIRKKKFVILVEGNIDILSSHRAGIENIVAPLGTAFTMNQAKLIKRFADQVYFSFDTDDAGTKALERAIDIVEKIGLKHKVINLTGYQDADEMIVKTPGEWEVRLASPMNSVEYLFKVYSRDVDLRNPDNKSTFRDRVMPVINSLTDEVQQAFFMNKLADIVGVEEKRLEKRLIKKPHVEVEEEPEEVKVPISKVKVEAEEYLAAIIMQNKLKPKDFNVNIFEADHVKEILKLYFEEKKIEENAEHYQEYMKIMTIDLSEIKDIQEEVNYRYRVIYRHSLQRILKKLSAEASTEEGIKKLSDHVEELKNIEKLKII
jgi:DNA primase